MDELDPEHTPTVTAPWAGHPGPGADDTKPVHLVPAPRGDASHLGHGDASPWAQGDGRRPRSSAGYLPAGVQTARVELHRWRTVHHDKWMLDVYRAAAQSPNGARYIAEYKAERERIDGDLRGRTYTLAVVLLILAVTFVVGLIVATWLTLIATTVATMLGFSAYGWWGTNRPTPPLLALPPGPAPVSGPAERLPVEPIDPDVERFTEALKDAGFLKDNRPVRVFGAQAMPNGNGRSYTVELPTNLSARAVINKRHDVANGLGTNDPRLILLPDPDMNRRLWVWEAAHDPLAGPPNLTELLDANQIDVTQGIPFGWTVTGERVLVTAVGTHWLIAGGSGSGKSESGGLIPLGYAFDPHTRMILMDPEGFGVWSPYEQIAEVIQGTSAEKLAEMADKLEWIVEHEFARRERKIAEYKARGKLAPKAYVTPKMAQDATAGLEYLLICIEECHALFRAQDPEVRKKATEACVQIITRGRKYGISLVLFTQKPTGDNVPTEISAIANTRLLFSCEKPEMADAAMPGWRNLGMDPLALEPDDQRGGGNPGAGYLKGIGLVAPSRKWVLMRADWADMHLVPDALGRALELRRRVRLQLLPAGRRGTTTLVELTENDPQHLVNVIDVFAEGEEALRSQTIIERLQAAHAGLYADLTPLGMNTFLRPFDLETVKINREGLRGLRLGDVVDALERIETERGDGRGDDAADPRQ